MAWVAAAVTAGSLVNGYMQGEAAAGAAGSQRDAANASIDLQRQMYNQGREDLNPWRNYGISALDRMNGFDSNYTARNALQKQLEEAQTNSQNLAGYLANGVDNDGWGAKKKEWDDLAAKYTSQIAAMGPAQKYSPEEAGNQIMQMDPGYQFRLAQGNKAINAAASARGRAMGGATLKELSRYGQDYASNEYGNAYNRLAQQSGQGLQASQSMGQMGQNYGQQFGSNMAAIGNANAAGQIGQANAIGGMLQNGIAGGGYLFSNYLNRPKTPQIGSTGQEWSSNGDSPFFNVV